MRELNGQVEEGLRRAREGADPDGQGRLEDRGEEVYIIGVIGMGPASHGRAVVKTNMGNIPSRQYNSPDARRRDLAADHLLLEELTVREGPTCWRTSAVGPPRDLTVWAISMLAFAIIQLPPGDYVSSYIAQMASMGSVVTDEEAQSLRIQYGLGSADLRPVLEVDEADRGGELRLFDGVAAARHRGDRRARCG